MKMTMFDDSDVMSDTAQESLEEIEDLLDSGSYDWASETLEGIYETIARTGRVTDGQRRAIDNIAGAGGRA